MKRYFRKLLSQNTSDMLVASTVLFYTLLILGAGVNFKKRDFQLYGIIVALLLLALYESIIIHTMHINSLQYKEYRTSIFLVSGIVLQLMSILNILDIINFSIYSGAVVFQAILSIIYLFVPYKVSDDSEFSDFYTMFSKCGMNINKLKKVVDNRNKFNYFFRIANFLTVNASQGKRIIRNLKKLRNEDLPLYFELKSKIKRESEGTSFNSSGMFLTILGLLATIINNKYYKDATVLISPKWNKIMPFSMLILIMIMVVIWVVKTVSSLKYNHYDEMLMYFEESEK